MFITSSSQIIIYIEKECFLFCLFGNAIPYITIHYLQMPVTNTHTFSHTVEKINRALSVLLLSFYVICHTNRLLYL